MRKTLSGLGLRALVLVAIVGMDAPAQDSLRTASTLTAITFGMPGVDGEALYPLVTVGMTFNGFRRDQLSPEFAFGTMPYALGVGLPVLGTRLGLAVPSVFSGRFILLPSAGVGAVMVASEQAGAAPSIYAGVAAVIGTGRTSAFRAGVTWHRFGELRRPVWLLELGVVRPFRHRPG
jgi:hypothetical protein